MGSPWHATGEIQHRFSPAAVDKIVPIAGVHVVIAGAGEKRVVTGSAEDGIPAAAGIDEVVAAVCVDCVGVTIVSRTIKTDHIIKIGSVKLAELLKIMGEVAVGKIKVGQLARKE